MTNPFWKKHTYHIITLVVLVIIAIVSWNLQAPPNNKPDQHEPSTLEQEVTEDKSGASEEPVQPEEKETVKVYSSVDFSSQNREEILTNAEQQKSKTSSKEEEAAQKTEVSDDSNELIVDGQKYKLSYTNGKSVYDFMFAIASDSKMAFKTKDYGPGLGYFVTQINGKKNDDAPGYFWIYYINGEKATVGISNYILKPHDIIEWKYEESEI